MLTMESDIFSFHMRNRPLILLFLLSLATAGIWSTGLHSLQRQVYRKQVKRMIKHSLRKDECVRLAFHERELTALDWKHDKEFRYRGGMYDVIHRENRSDSIVLFCWWDAEENRLNESWEALTSIGFTRRPGHQQQQTLWHHWIRGFYQNLPPAIHPLLEQDAEKIYGSPSTNWLNNYLSVPVPPPRFC